MKMKPAVITPKLSRQYKKILSQALHRSVFYKELGILDEGCMREWKFYLGGKSNSIPILFQPELAYDEKFVNMINIVNTAYGIIPEKHYEVLTDFQIDAHLNSKRGSSFEIGRAAIEHVRFTHLIDWKSPIELWRAWKRDKEMFAPAVVEEQIVRLLNEIAESIGLKTKD